jgi:hypothetical protein
MCVEAGPVLGAESVDFLFNWCDLKVFSEDHIRHVPWYTDIGHQIVIFFLEPHFICTLYIYIQLIGVRIGCYGLGRALSSALP